MGNLKNSREVESIKNFAKNFGDEDKIKNFKTDLIPSNILLQMADFFMKSGDFAKSINIYLALLDKDEFINNKKLRHEILSNLGNCYLKAGFLQKSENFFLESLRLFARNEEALNSLIILYEKSNKYEKAIKVMESLEEFTGNIKNGKSYLEAKLILQNKNLNEAKKIDKLFKISTENSFVVRLYLEYILKNRKQIEFHRIKNFDLNDSIDILWNLIDKDFETQNLESDIINQISNAKGFSNYEIKNPIIELEILQILTNTSYDKINLGFEYNCSECKNIFPLYFYRCPICQSIATAKIEPIIIKKTNYNY